MPFFVKYDRFSHKDTSKGKEYYKKMLCLWHYKNTHKEKKVMGKLMERGNKHQSKIIPLQWPPF